MMSVKLVTSQNLIKIKPDDSSFIFASTTTPNQFVSLRFTLCPKIRNLRLSKKMFDGNLLVMLSIKQVETLLRALHRAKYAVVFWECWH